MEHSAVHVIRTARRPIRLIVNGRFAAHTGLHEAVDRLCAAGARVEVRVTWERGDASRFAAEAARDGSDAVAAGGDGTLHEVVNGALAGGGLPCALGVVPLGTANDFASACGIAGGDPAEALGLAVNSIPRRIDVGRVDGRCFINVVSGGFGAEITAQTPERYTRLLGRMAYLLTGLAHVKDIEARPIRLEAPGLAWSGSAYMLAVGNARQAGGGFQVCPLARLDDGLLDVLLLPELPRLELLALFESLLLQPPALLAHERVLYWRVPSLKVQAPTEIQFNLDGEPLRGRVFQFDVWPARLPFHLPPGVLSNGPERAEALATPAVRAAMTTGAREVQPA
jgi:lipid kinase YegS